LGLDSVFAGIAGIVRLAFIPEFVNPRSGDLWRGRGRVSGCITRGRETE
jgi:hypothetical protein